MALQVACCVDVKVKSLMRGAANLAIRDVAAELKEAVCFEEIV